MSSKPKKSQRPRAKKPEPREVPVVDAVCEACSDIVELGEEMRSWADSMEDKLSHTMKYETVSSTADLLENLNDPADGIGDDVKKALEGIKVTIQDRTPRRAAYSRADRMGHAVYILQAAIDRLEQAAEKNELGAFADDVDDFKSEIDNYMSEAGDAEFPGMYG
jgi:hypothetical protein